MSKCVTLGGLAVALQAACTAQTGGQDMNSLIISESSGAGPIGRITSWLSSRAAAVAAARRRHRTYRVLSSLDDRTLHDIGLHRTMLLGVAVHGILTLKDVAPPASSNLR